MTAHAFLDATCVLWMERDDGYDESGYSAPGESGGTWRDWMVDFLATAHVMGEGFDGKRPNCSAGWQHHLEAALDAHDTSFPEVLVAAFGMDADGRPRRILKPFGSQNNIFRILYSALEIMDTYSKTDMDVSSVPDEDRIAVLDILRRALFEDFLNRRTKAEDADVKNEHIPVGIIAAARRYAVSSMNTCGGRRTTKGNEWSRFIDYLDAVMLRRHPTSSFLGMPLMW